MSGALFREIEGSLGVRVASAHRVTGGDINDAYQVTLQDGRRVFVKTRVHAPEDMYVREAEGLAWLLEANALRVPQVLAATQSLLALEWIEPARHAAHFDEAFGRGLAQLHRFGARSFGLGYDNFIGPLPQPNLEDASWVSFYRDLRLAPMLARAHSHGHVSSALARDFEALFHKLPELIGEAEPPARLHGDLWSGNVHADEHGEPVLIDPAVYGGHREVDLAMLRLFGAPSARFFAAYDEAYPRAKGHEERIALYQLYPLLVHVCLFGASYVGQLERALARYL